MAVLTVLKPARPGLGVAAIILACLALGATPASGATVTEAPTISGVPSTRAAPSPGLELSASAGEWTPQSATASYDWLRCDAAGGACTPVRGSCDRRYTVRDADLGHTLRVRLTVSEPGQPRASEVSGPTARVTVTYSIPTPGDDGANCVEVTPTGPGEATFTSGGQTGPGTTPAPDTTLSFINPFPVVRIAGRFKGTRTRLTRITIRARRGVRIRLRCSGRGCPYRRRAVATKLVRVRSLQRTYRPRAKIEIRVTQPRRIGKYTRLTTRRGKAPLRIDRCLMPGSTRPVRCPSA
jgi:hypothetical protein